MKIFFLFVLWNAWSDPLASHRTTALQISIGLQAYVQPALSLSDAVPDDPTCETWVITATAAGRPEVTCLDGLWTEPDHTDGLWTEPEPAIAWDR